MGHNAILIIRQLQLVFHQYFINLLVSTLINVVIRPLEVVVVVRKEVFGPLLLAAALEFC